MVRHLVPVRPMATGTDLDKRIVNRARIPQEISFMSNDNRS
jgi:hypothetical protein